MNTLSDRGKEGGTYTPLQELAGIGPQKGGYELNELGLPDDTLRVFIVTSDLSFTH